MRHAIVAVTTALAVGSATARAQTIPVTVAQADAEAIAFPHADAASTQQSLFARPFAGTGDRHCVAARSEADPHATGSLRSGDMIVRGRWNDPSDLTAGDEHKFLWLPLHGSGGSEQQRTPLVLRADRVGAPGDSLRLTIPSLVHTPAPPSRRMYGYPSLVRFPTAGQWLVVATAGDDWGCFILDVSPARASTNGSR